MRLHGSVSVVANNPKQNKTSLLTPQVPRVQEIIDAHLGPVFTEHLKLGKVIADIVNDIRFDNLGKIACYALFVRKWIPADYVSIRLLLRYTMFHIHVSRPYMFQSPFLLMRHPALHYAGWMDGWQ